MATTKRRAEIAQLLERGKREGLTYAKLAEIAGIQPSTMSTWAWRLRRERRERGEPEGGTEVPEFVELIGAGSTPDARVEIELRSGRRILVTPDIDSDRLARLIGVD